jgi:hypothetical protein
MRHVFMPVRAPLTPTVHKRAMLRARPAHRLGSETLPNIGPHPKRPSGLIVQTCGDLLGRMVGVEPSHALLQHLGKPQQVLVIRSVRTSLPVREVLGVHVQLVGKLPLKPAALFTRLTDVYADGSGETVSRTSLWTRLTAHAVSLSRYDQYCQARLPESVLTGAERLLGSASWLMAPSISPCANWYWVAVRLSCASRAIGSLPVRSASRNLRMIILADAETSHTQRTDPQGSGQGLDGTQLGGCFKLYLPPPIGNFGMVFTLAMNPTGQRELTFVAFGVTS